jgi:hypothetical protein
VSFGHIKSMDCHTEDIKKEANIIVHKVYKTRPSVKKCDC